MITRYLWICLTIVLVLTIAQPSRGQAGPPTLEFVPTISRDKVEHNDPVDVYLSITNKSKVPVTIYGFSIAGNAFAKEQLPKLPISISPYGSSQPTVTLKAQENTRFGLHRLLIVLHYKWFEEGKEKKEFDSAQTAVITVEVTRKFEDEAKGFPGGTAAFLYLLLPIIPAILSYQMVEQLRTTGKVNAPKFDAAYIVPAFFAAIILSFLMLWLARGNVGIDYSNPKVFATVLAASLVLGMVIPGVHWAWNIIQGLRWAFSSKDPSLPRYLDKALLGPRSPDQFIFKWVKAKTGDETWEGVLLQQPNGTRLLGACLQASPDVNGVVSASNKAALEAVLDRDGNIKDARQLVELAKAGQITLSYLKKIKRGNTLLEVPVVVDEVAGLVEEESVEITPLVFLVG